jgi:hypothetical protein
MQPTVGSTFTPLPAAFIKTERHPILDPMAPADIRVEAKLLIGKRAAQDDVFGILGIG